MSTAAATNCAGSSQPNAIAFAAMTGYAAPEPEPRVCSEKAGSGRSGGTLPPVLDACCGSRMFWFDKCDPRALFVDKRRETHPIDIGTPGTVGRSPIVVNPDMLADFTELPFPDCSFPLVVFDPPHIERTAALGLLTKKYGHLTGDWRDMLRRGFAECFRVLKPSGTLIFKWAESDYPVSEILKLTPEKPLFGHQSGKQSATHWICFFKGGGGAEQVGDRNAPQHSGPVQHSA